MSYTTTSTSTYTVTDIEAVVRRFSADIEMIAASSGALAREKARAYAHDVEVLARNGYLRRVDITLLKGDAELRAVGYEVNTTSGHLTMSRPGGVLWPCLAGTWVRIVLSYTDSFTDAAKDRMRPSLEINWGPSSADTSHSGLQQTGWRDYASNGYGLQRKDYSQ